MSKTTDKQTVYSTRRAFFLRSGAALGAGLASASAGAANLVFDDRVPLKDQLSELHQLLSTMEDREAIRQLQLVYRALLENRAYDAVVQLFTDDAGVKLNGESFSGKDTGIRRLYTEVYGQQRGLDLHTGFRQDQAQQYDEVMVSEDLQSARAVFHCQVEISRPQNGNSALEEMARLQGQYASSRWVNGKFDMAYRKVAGQWKISNLEFTA